MDGRRFDSLTRALSAAKTRRGFLGGLAALAAGLVGARGADAQQPPPVITFAYCGTVRCRTRPEICREGCVCCVYSNGNSRCSPPNQCGAGGVIIGGPSTTTTTRAPTTTTTTTTTTEEPTTTTEEPTTTTTTTEAPCQGRPCDTVAECCSGYPYCFNGTCLTCLPSDVGAPCSTGSDCCSGICFTTCAST